MSAMVLAVFTIFYWFGFLLGRVVGRRECASHREFGFCPVCDRVPRARARRSS